MKDTSARTTIKDFINEHPLAVLSTVDGDGYPHGSTLYAGSNDSLDIYFITKSGTTKSRNIDIQSVVSLTFSDELEQKTLQLTGNAVEVVDALEGDKAISILLNVKHSMIDFRLPITKLNAGSYIVYKVRTYDALLSMYGKTGHIDIRYHLPLPRS